MPLSIIMIASFNSGKTFANFEGLSLHWYIKLFQNDQLQKAFYYTLLVSLLSTCCSLILGFIGALGIYALSLKSKLKNYMLTVNALPIVNPDVVTAVALLILFITLSVPFGFTTMLVAHIMFSTPFVVVTLFPRLHAIDINQLNASKDLGATSTQTLRKVILPQLKTALLTSALIAFTMSFDDFIISYFVTGNGVTNISIEIYAMARRGINPMINALSTIVIMMSILFVSTGLVLQNTKHPHVKRIAQGVLAILLFLPLLFVGYTGITSRNDREKLYVYNWGEYIDPETISRFEDKYNCDVIYETYDSNETMYQKIRTGKTPYDVVIPSDYMVEKMRSEKMLKPLDMSKIPNNHYILEELLRKSFDPKNTYSIPYFYGTVGILYDASKIDTVDSWNILFDKTYKNNIYMYNSQRDSFMVALKKLGYSLNTTQTSKLQKAQTLLIEQKPLVYAYVTDEVIDSMIAGNASLAVVYSGDATYIMSENKNLKYAIPKEGTNIWIDSMVIPKTSHNTERAHDFINFMMEPNIAKMNTELVMYSTPNTKTMALLKDTPWAQSQSYRPSKEVLKNPKNEFYHSTDRKQLEYLNTLWEDILRSH